MRPQCLLVAFTGIAIFTGLAATQAAALRRTGVYYGVSRPAAHHAEIYFDLLRNGTAKWDAAFTGPCRDGSTALARTIGTEEGDPPAPPIRFHRGRFLVRQHFYVQASDVDGTIVFSGHRTRTGLAGTVHYIETEYGITCDTGRLVWHAHPTRLPFR